MNTYGNVHVQLPYLKKISKPARVLLFESSISRDKIRSSKFLKRLSDYDMRKISSNGD